MTQHAPIVPGRSLVAAFLAVVVLATGLAGCSGDDGDSTTTALVTTSVPSTTAPQGPPPSAVETGWSDLAVGDCFDTIDDPVVDELAVFKVPCDVPHAYEVYDIVEASAVGDSADEEGADEDSADEDSAVGEESQPSEDGSYPGPPRMQNWAEEACFSRFEEFVGVRWTISELDIATWWPSEDSWNTGDRTVLCTVMDHTRQPLEGTQRGSGR